MNSRIAKSYRETCTLSLMVALAGFCFFFMLSGNTLAAEDQFDNAPLVGVVKNVSLADHKLVIKAGKGKRQHIVITEQTTFKGVMLAEEIKVKQKVKVWYVLDGDQFMAVKIEVMPELGC